ncbi:negative regulator of systemic acquired resistance SNI1 isoform X2 [Argentina anserina]|uniref:negative regulator of systemic acquired resistance SNI1 isoform X2 n=1 Tax=Argentina anserina TaxID=57926 RepID=UPI00217636C6|nr:negative regulator of systemic acquired resistance SNI1 isoform X2 [Potentilla anserina]
MENPSSSKRTTAGALEENILAILDSTEADDTHYANDDRTSFLDAVRAASLVPEIGTPPTYKWFESIFSILRIGKSLELTMASFKLLNELDKCFPRVHLSAAADEMKSSSELSLIVENEGWSPFAFSLDSTSSERVAANNPGGYVDSFGFQHLIENLADATAEPNFQASEAKSLGNMLLFQYLVNVLEGDFQPRNSVYAETANWVLLRESLINMLLVSRKINYKKLMKDCLGIMCKLYQTNAGFTDDLISSKKSMAVPAKNFDTAAAIALLEIGQNTCTAMQKFFIMIMELDLSKKMAETRGSTTRADGVRNPLLEIVLDELTYDEDILDSFLQVFNEPKWKLEIVVQYLWKYIGKTRRSNGPTDDASFSGALKCFSNVTSTKTTIKKIRPELTQLLLAHGLQAHLSLPCEQHVEGTSVSSEERSISSLIEVSKDMISAFRNLKTADKKMEILPLGKEALFMAATIISAQS